MLLFFSKAILLLATTVFDFFSLVHKRYHSCTIGNTIQTMTKAITTNHNHNNTCAANQVLDMNNLAIARILDDDPIECLEIFRYTLGRLQNSLQELVDSGVATSMATVVAAAKLAQERQIEGVHGLTQFHSIPLDNCTSKTGALHLSQSNGTFSFFHRMMTMAPIHVPEETDLVVDVVDTSLLQYQNQLLVLLFFNMAVAHHQVGLQQGKSSELQIALQLYELAFSMVEGSRQVALGDQQVLLLAIYNNMGHCHSCFSNTEAMQACVDWIQKIFWAFPPAIRRQPSSSSHSSSKSMTMTTRLEISDLEFFIQYTPLRPSQQGNLAPAA